MPHWKRRGSSDDSSPEIVPARTPFACDSSDRCFSGPIALAETADALRIAHADLRRDLRRIGRILDDLASNGAMDDLAGAEIASAFHDLHATLLVHCGVEERDVFDKAPGTVAPGCIDFFVTEHRAITEAIARFAGRVAVLHLGAHGSELTDAVQHLVDHFAEHRAHEERSFSEAPRAGRP
jgi:hypothetical protein